MTFSLRDAAPGDLETLWRIDQKCFAPGIAYSRTELSRFVKQRGSFTLVGVDDDSKQISGFIVAIAGRCGHIVTIDVLAIARCSGLGSKLLQAAEQSLRKSGSNFVTLETAIDNQAALSFYKRHNYQIVETIPHYYSNGVDALSLRKAL